MAQDIISRCGNSGSDLRWTIQLTDVQGTAVFPGAHGFYDVALRLVAVRNIGAPLLLIHLLSTPSVNIPTYIDMGTTRPPMVHKVYVHWLLDLLMWQYMIVLILWITLWLVDFSGEKIAHANGRCMLQFRKTIQTT